PGRGPGPAPGPVWNWQPVSLADLTALRMQLRTALANGARLPGSRDGDVDPLLHVVDELTSNGLRHGRAPVRLEVATTDDGWLVEVSDADPGHPPSPARGRDPAAGGL